MGDGTTARRGWVAAPSRVRARPNEVHIWRAERGVCGGPLRRVLSHYLTGGRGRIAVRTGSHGKPELAPPGHSLQFNLSHSDGIALIAVTLGCEVGIDVERERPRRDFARLAERALGPDAAVAVRTAPLAGRAAVFYSAWVSREAISKCHGVGLGGQLPSGPTALSRFEAGEGLPAAVAISRSMPLPLRFFRLDRTGC